MRKLNFIKMQGIGNDYVYIDLFQETVENPSDLAVRLSHRRYGIGGDGLVLMTPSDIADLKMIMFNADGSESQNCGNALRCVAKYAFENNIAKGDKVTIDTKAGIVDGSLGKCDNSGSLVTIEFRPPSFRGCDISDKLDESIKMEHSFYIGGREFVGTLVSMGNPHFVIYCDSVDAVPLEDWGPEIEQYDQFSQKINVEFVEILSRFHVRQRTWERGSGETWACGSGAAAVCAAGVLTQKTDNDLRIDLTGGTLHLSWTGQGQPLKMSGLATEVFRGTIMI